MNEYNQKRINPPFWQHDCHILKRLYREIKIEVHRWVNKNSEVLDYGCGPAPYEHLLTGRCSRYIKLDIGKNNSADILVLENEKIPLPDSSWDVILSTQVLEHVADPGFYLSECRRLLKPGGKLILSTHGIWPYHPFPEDYWRFTESGLKKILRDNRFKTVNFKGLIGPFASSVQFTVLLLADFLVKKPFPAKLILVLLSVISNISISVLDPIFPYRKNSDSSLYFLCAEKY